MENKLKNQGAAIKALRKKYNLTQAEFAEKVGNADQKIISRWERELHSVSLPTFLEWCRILEVEDMNEILKE